MVDAVNTLNPGENASVEVGFASPSVHFTFNLPRGADGGPGATGEVGPPFTNFTVNSTATLPPGSAATVDLLFSAGTMFMNFGIPRGADGEVTTAQLNTAITTAVATTAQNPSGVASFTGSISDPPTQAEMVALAAKVEELLNALKRA